MSEGRPSASCWAWAPYPRSHIFLMTHLSYPLPPRRDITGIIFSATQKGESTPSYPSVASPPPLPITCSSAPPAKDPGVGLVWACAAHGAGVPAAAAFGPHVPPRKPQPPVTRYTSSWLGQSRPYLAWGKTPLPHLGGLLLIAPARGCLFLLEGASTRPAGAASQRLERFLEAVAVGASGQVTCPLTPPAAVSEMLGWAWQ